jgi:hypothetical protein
VVGVRGHTETTVTNHSYNETLEFMMIKVIGHLWVVKQQKSFMVKVELGLGPVELL